MSKGPVLIGDSDSKSIPHKKCQVGRNTYYVCRYPEGDYCIHEDNGSGEGFGGYTVEFLMEDGTIEAVRGPFILGGSVTRDHQMKAVAEQLGIPEEEFCAKAVRLRVGRNLDAYRKQPEIVYEESEYIVGPWRERLRPEWAGQGFSVALHQRGVVTYASVDVELSKLKTCEV